jgi:hypothetical protein
LEQCKCQDTIPLAILLNIEKGRKAARFYSRSHRAVIRVYDAAGDIIETHEHSGDLKEW